MMVDPITDMLNRIRNAQAVSKRTVIIPFSKLKFQISKILEKEGFVQKTDKKRRRRKKVIEIWLKYNQEKEGLSKIGAITELKRISKPGRRVYSGVKDLKRFRKGLGVVIVSTPKGVMTDKDARKQNLGGEVLFEVW